MRKIDEGIAAKSLASQFHMVIEIMMKQSVWEGHILLGHAV